MLAMSHHADAVLSAQEGGRSGGKLLQACGVQSAAEGPAC